MGPMRGGHNGMRNPARESKEGDDKQSIGERVRSRRRRKRRRRKRRRRSGGGGGMVGACEWRKVGQLSWLRGSASAPSAHNRGTTVAHRQNQNFK